MRQSFSIPSLLFLIWGWIIAVISLMIFWQLVLCTSKLVLSGEWFCHFVPAFHQLLLRSAYRGWAWVHCSSNPNTLWFLFMSYWGGESKLMLKSNLRIDFIRDSLTRSLCRLSDLLHVNYDELTWILSTELQSCSYVLLPNHQSIKIWLAEGICFCSGVKLLGKKVRFNLAFWRRRSEICAG